ncbi:hypothetical protein ZHAS_00005148 [Anopheles sinensis]|uniref:Uncharacterized protein n=1 Tax=Anopheles sinensis TaxID=74873 RepID=A0A084VJ32_ANOSI|nr:hypothetical protein ZHAS_00005148 [Anopheles sinensis]
MHLSTMQCSAAPLLGARLLLACFLLYATSTPPYTHSLVLADGNCNCIGRMDGGCCGEVSRRCLPPPGVTRGSSSGSRGAKEKAQEKRDPTRPAIRLGSGSCLYR